MTFDDVIPGQMHDPGDGAGTRAHDMIGVLVVEGEEGASCVVLPDGRVLSVIVQPSTEAEALAAARIARGDSDLLAADCKPVAHAVADALVAAGMGSG